MNKEEKESYKMYEEAAEYYHDFRTKINQGGWFYNELLEMPTTLSMLGNIKGKKVLDYGCGSGIYAKILHKRGAIVKGFDISNKMLDIARRDNPTIEFKQGSGYKIPFKEQFDVVVAPLVLHYMEDWDKVFKEVSRVLKKGGMFIFSTDNPVFEVSKSMKIKGKKYKVLGLVDYWKEEKHIATWINPYTKKEVPTPSYHKTFESIIKTILKRGFEITDYKDCFPVKKAKKLFPKEYELYTKVPKFMVIKLRKK